MDSLQFLIVFFLRAQTNTGTITGLVTDPAGAAVSGTVAVGRRSGRHYRYYRYQELRGAFPARGRLR
jgi:hypothetical protein